MASCEAQGGWLLVAEILETDGALSFYKNNIFYKCHLKKRTQGLGKA